MDNATLWMPFVLATCLIAVLGLIVVYDAWVLVVKVGTPTVSDVVKRLSALYPAMPFFAGFVAGHLWF